MSSRRSEASIEAWLNKQVEAMGGISYKFVSPMNPGVPDRIYIFPEGRVYFVELKTETGRLSKKQRWQAERIRKTGADCRAVKGMAQARAFVEEVRNEIQAT